MRLPATPEGRPDDGDTPVPGPGEPETESVRSRIGAGPNVNRILLDAAFSGARLSSMMAEKTKTW